jgi:hypothetical protein
MAAPAAKPVLQQAIITVNAISENAYKVKQTFTITNPDKIAKGVVENTLAKLQGAQVTELTISANGAKANPKLTEGSYLTKIAFPLPADVTGKFTYEVSYSVKIPQGTFSVPLVVPMYATSGKAEVVKVDFTAPAGNYIHEDSFPIIKNLPADNKLSATMANIPSHLRYSFGKQPSSMLNEYNLISVTVFLVLMLIIVRWFLAERKKVQIQMQRQGGGV